jgi:hypothetical protein
LELDGAIAIAKEEAARLIRGKKESEISRRIVIALSATIGIEPWPFIASIARNT